MAFIGAAIGTGSPICSALGSKRHISNRRSKVNGALAALGGSQNFR